MSLFAIISKHPLNGCVAMLHIGLAPTSIRTLYVSRFRKKTRGDVETQILTHKDIQTD